MYLRFAFYRTVFDNKTLFMLEFSRVYPTRGCIEDPRVTRTVLDPTRVRVRFLRVRVRVHLKVPAGVPVSILRGTSCVRSVPEWSAVPSHGARGLTAELELADKRKVHQHSASVNVDEDAGQTAVQTQRERDGCDRTGEPRPDEIETISISISISSCRRRRGLHSGRAEAKLRPGFRGDERAGGGRRSRRNPTAPSLSTTQKFASSATQENPQLRFLCSPRRRINKLGGINTIHKRSKYHLTIFGATGHGTMKVLPLQKLNNTMAVAVTPAPSISFSSHHHATHEGAEFTNNSTTYDPESSSHSSGMFSGSQNSTVTAQTLTNVTNQYPASAPSDFRMIPLGDIDLRHEIRVDNLTGIVDYHRGPVCFRRMHSARVEGRKAKVTVAMYHGTGAEEEWRQEIAKYMSIRQV
ncbi:hypothetical protein DFH08DRAFT_1012601 [Mycena albidolilacea]|uniref:Uncharacterized protein n=1 Tax=Mycena albidolilacea TaxID=1033008 RepID=A0AAD6ZUQ5_9AGAR|nr:hypothetical protein DFH08DRAFT_1012601 [Mycena albidolilacea]